MKKNTYLNFLKNRFYVHLIILCGIVFFLAGALFNLFGTNEEKLVLYPGEEGNIAGNDIILKDFHVLKNPDNTEKDFISSLDINGSKHLLRVNYPLAIDKGLLYQWAFIGGWDVHLYFSPIDLNYEGNDNSIINAGNYIVKIGPFIPDFGISDGEITTLSKQPLNPAVLVEYYKDNRLAAKQWVFYKESVKTEPEDFEIKCVMTGYKENLASVLKFIEAPGDIFIIIGIIIIFVGSIFLFIKNISVNLKI
jgi:hypothetical protein